MDLGNMNNLAGITYPVIGLIITFVLSYTHLKVLDPIHKNSEQIQKIDEKLDKILELLGNKADVKDLEKETATRTELIDKIKERLEKNEININTQNAHFEYLEKKVD